MNPEQTHPVQESLIERIQRLEQDEFGNALELYHAYNEQLNRIAEAANNETDPQIRDLYASHFVEYCGKRTDASKRIPYDHPLNYWRQLESQQRRIGAIPSNLLEY